MDPALLTEKLMAKERCACNRAVKFRTVISTNGNYPPAQTIITLPGGEVTDLRPYWRYAVQMEANKYDHVYYACDQCIKTNHRFFKRV